MRNRIVFFSGGLSSFAVAHVVKEKFPNDNVVLFFAETMWEDEDLYRFIDEVSDKLKLPMVIHSLRVDPVELMIQQKTLFSNRLGNCSVFLKTRLSRRVLSGKRKDSLEIFRNKELLKSEDYIKDPVLYFGIGFDEFHRVEGIKKNWSDWEVEFPLLKEYIDFDELLAHYDIKKPRMYDLGFAHNNCKGRCIKAGKKHYRHLHAVDPDTFWELCNIERTISDYVASWSHNKNNPLMNDEMEFNYNEMMKWYISRFKYNPQLKGVPCGVKKPTIMANGMYLDELITTAESPNESIGGCGCFIGDK